MATPAADARLPGRIAYRRILVPVAGDDDSELGVELAAELAPERGGSVTAVFVVEVPPELPLDAHMEDDEAAAKTALAKAEAIAASRGVRLRARTVRSRSRGEAIVAEADAEDADLVVIRAEASGRRRLFGKTVEYVLRHASCRVLVAAPRRQ